MSHSTNPDSHGAGAPEDEIEVTPAMVEAGEDIILLPASSRTTVLPSRPQPLEAGVNISGAAAMNDAC